MRKVYIILFLLIWLTLGLTVTALNNLGQGHSEAEVPAASHAGAVIH